MAKSLKENKEIISDDILAQLSAFKRQPFIEILARMVSCAPNAIALQAFANDHPDRWASAISNMAKLSGFTEKLEINNNITVQISNLGDAELMAEIEKTNKALLELEAKDITPVDADEILENSDINPEINEIIE